MSVYATDVIAPIGTKVRVWTSTHDKSDSPQICLASVTGNKSCVYVPLSIRGQRTQLTLAMAEDWAMAYREAVKWLRENGAR